MRRVDGRARWSQWQGARRAQDVVLRPAALLELVGRYESAVGPVEDAAHMILDRR